MSLLRKVSAEFRQERAKARIARAQAAQIAHMKRMGEAIRAGMIKLKMPTLPKTARMVMPREELKLRLGTGHREPFNVGHRMLAYRGQRTGRFKAYELRTYERKPERNKHAGYYSPGTWMEPCKP